MRAVNLLPDNYTPGVRSAPRRLPLPGRLADPTTAASALGALLVVAVLAIGHVTQSRDLSAKTETLAGLQQELAERTRPEPVAADDAAVRVAAATAASGARVPWEEVLHQFALVLPADVSVTSLTTADSMFNLAGYTASQPSVARLMRQLAESPTLADVQLQSSTRMDMDGRAVTQFTIVATVQAAGGAS